MLVEQAEKSARGKTVFTVVEAGSPGINEWTERGYVPGGGLFQMVVKLEIVRPLPSVPEGITIRSPKRSEERQAVETVNSVFGCERFKEGFVEKGKAESPPFDEEWVQLAELHGGILSVVVSWSDVPYNKFFGEGEATLVQPQLFPSTVGKSSRLLSRPGP
jgi:hypothetical protein